MSFTNSKLATYTALSPNYSSRTGKITKITIHHMAGNLTVEQCGSVFKPTSRQASSNYGVGTDGRIGLYVEEKNRAWTSSNRENDNMAVTIEVANDSRGPDWHVSDKALAATIELCADICRRNGIESLNYTGDKSGNLTRHNMFASTQCPGPYLQSKFPYIAEEVNKLLKGKSNRIDVLKFKTNTPQQTIEMVGNIFTNDMKKTGILASISLAQFILESGWGKSDFAQNALNFFSMKANISGNTWDGSTWNGEKYTIKTSEWDGEKYVECYADFRKYNSIEDSIADHSAYLCNAMKGAKRRYNGLIGENDYKRAAEIIKAGGYATDPNYVTKLCTLIEKYGLTKYDTIDEQTTPAQTRKLKVGDLVKIIGTHYYTGKEIPSWVKKQNWYIKSVYSDYAIVNENEKHTNAINSPIRLSDLQLVNASISPVEPAEQPKPNKPIQQPTQKEIAVGDVVMFNGKKHYKSAAANIGTACKPGKATVTKIANGPHPYHLIRVQGEGSTVYGWVNAEDIGEMKKESDPFDGIKYFIKEEIKCKCNGRYCNGYPAEMNHTTLVVADRAREHFGSPANVSSGLRCKTHN